MQVNWGVVGSAIPALSVWSLFVAVWILPRLLPAVQRHVELTDELPVGVNVSGLDKGLGNLYCKSTSRDRHRKL